MPDKWLGAYYTLREGDEVAARKREKLCSKATPRRSRFIVGTLDAMERKRRLEKEPWRRGFFKAGDYVEVEHRASLSDPVERVTGLVISKQKRTSLASSFDLLCDVDGTPMEYKFPLFSPLLLSVEVRGQVKKASGSPKPKGVKLFYFRDRVRDLSIPKPARPGGETERPGAGNTKKKFGRR